MEAAITTLVEARTWAREWLFRQALPLWWEVGYSHRRGGFHDLIDREGRAVAAIPKRIRVQARQIFVYAEAGKLGWDGPWRQAVAEGLGFLTANYRLPNGVYRRAVAPASPSEDDYDLYDQAFVLLALAAAYEALGKPAEPLHAARELLSVMERRLSHPLAGFEEALPPRTPLRSNPHMHLLEALLAWLDLCADPGFRRAADAIVSLALDRMIDPATGAMAEYFDARWYRLGGADDIREPGHQYEWAYLLTLAARRLSRDTAVASDRLLSFAERHGVDPARGVAIFSTDPIGQPVDTTARLWAQTERLRALLMLRPASDPEHLCPAAAGALEAVRRFLDVPVPGLWRDRMLADGTFVDQPAPASSLYHLMTGLHPLLTRPVAGS